MEPPDFSDHQFLHRVRPALPIRLQTRFGHAGTAASTIKEGLANAEKNKVELARTEAQRLEVMAQANAQATKMIEEARAAAARVEQRETQKAIAAAEQIVVKAQEAAVQEHARMLNQLKQELGRLVVQTTATVTGKILTPEDQKRMAEETTVQITG